MFTLPTPVLGQITAFTVASPDLEASMAFYQKLGFSELFRGDFPFPFIQISDGAIMMMLRWDAKPYIALTYYTNDVDNVADALAAKGIQFTLKPSAGDMVRRYIMQSPDGANVSLVGFTEGMSQPPGPIMLKMKPGDFTNPEAYVNKVCGMYGEYAQPVANLDFAAEWYAKLGFIQLSRYGSPYPWGIYTDGLAVVGLHQTNSFVQPSITFFAADMAAKLNKLKLMGLPVTNEKSYTLTSPEGQKINLYSLGF